MLLDESDSVRTTPEYKALRPAVRAAVDEVMLRFDQEEFAMEGFEELIEEEGLEQAIYAASLDEHMSPIRSAIDSIRKVTHE